MRTHATLTLETRNSTINVLVCEAIFLICSFHSVLGGVVRGKIMNCLNSNNDNFKPFSMQQQREIIY